MRVLVRSLILFFLDTFEAYLRQRNPNCQLVKISAKTGEGMDRLANWVRHEVDLWRA